MATLMALTLSDPLHWLYAALGLGFVIFVHELGHFAVAKWCGVRVERFSIGFGPVIWSFMKGETEYALSVVPFGGYVKMLGQDDVDPNQMTSEDIAHDPRSYTAKTVPQRMAIISAGVIMNLITGSLFFAGAFMLGMKDVPAIVGVTSPGSPAWAAGLQPGDQLLKINGHDVATFGDITKRVMLSPGTIEIDGKHADGTDFQVELKPQIKKKDSRPTIGVAHAHGLTINSEPGEELGLTVPGSAASEAKPPFAAGDEIKRVDGEKVADYVEMEKILASERNKTIDFIVNREDKRNSKSENVTISVPPNPFRTLGLKMDIGQVAAIRNGSPADGKLQVGDKITHVISDRDKEREIGRDLNPLQLPDYLASLHGQSVKLRIKREGGTGTEAKVFEETVIPENRPGWIEHPLGEDSPLSAPAIGVAYYVLHSVLEVEPGTPSDSKIKPKDLLKKFELIAAKGAAPDGYEKVEMEFSDDKRNWPWAFWMLQQCPERSVKLTVSSGGTSREVVLESAPSKDWFMPTRGLYLEPRFLTRKEHNPITAISMGISQTNQFINEIYLILYKLFSGGINVRELRGPIGIAAAAIKISSQGLSPLLFFLGYLSVNLAVLNFLPIPLLDGGHMVFLCYEGIRGKPASERVLVYAQFLGLAFVVTLMVFVVGLDIFVHWLKLFS